MGQISKKLKARFTRWGSRYRKQIGKLATSAPVPKDVHDVRTLVAQGYDPLHALYISVQNITSVFAECVSVLPELKPYADIVGPAEDEYMPDGPPWSPLTRSYFTTWAFFDVRFGKDQETIGTCLLDLGDLLEMDPGIIEAVRQFQQSRMGVYEHVGTAGGRVLLRELVTGREFPSLCSSGYSGRPGELWYVRLCPPVFDVADYYVSVTTPYILTGFSKTDWTAYLNRAMLQINGEEDEKQRFYRLMKFGLSIHHWNEFLFLAYHHHQFEAIFLTGIPDVKGSLPHAEKGE